MRPADCLLLVRHQGMSASRQLVDWKAVQEAFHKPTRVKPHKLLQVCKQVVTSLFTSCQQVVFALLVPDLL